ncbi:MAG: MATE family efflux transporter, partial [Eubacterium sp.]
MARTQDLTVGSTKRLLLYFAFPTLVSNLFQQFYNLADTAIAGHILGDNALVAIGASSSIYSLVLTFAFGLNGGFGIIIAQCFGARDEKRLKNAVAQSLALNALISVVVCIASLFAAKPVLRLMNTPEARLDDAYGYIIIILTMIIIPMLYNLEATVLRSLGDSKTPLYFLILASILNIILDYVFIKYLNMGVRGAAAATIAAQLVAVLLCLAVIIKSFKIIRLSKESFIPSRAL